MFAAEAITNTANLHSLTSILMIAGTWLPSQLGAMTSDLVRLPKFVRRPIRAIAIA